MRCAVTLDNLSAGCKVFVRERAGNSENNVFACNTKLWSCKSDNDVFLISINFQIYISNHRTICRFLQHDCYRAEVTEFEAISILISNACKRYEIYRVTLLSQVHVRLLSMMFHTTRWLRILDRFLTWKLNRVKMWKSTSYFVVVEHTTSDRNQNSTSCHQNNQSPKYIRH